MSDSKRATLITVGASKGETKKVKKTVRLTINLVESNESKYPELNYKELVIAEERKNTETVQNGKTEGLNPFSDNDEDVERVARKFEQKYGGNSTYGRTRSKNDDFADIGAGYDDNSFIDNTDGYDEMIPPECDTLYGGFYINSGSLEFKNVDPPPSDDEPRGGRNKRRLSSSSSEEESSDSSSGSDSGEEKDTKGMVNGAADSHHTEHRKKKNKQIDKKKANKVRRTDSSAATSGKQTSDENNPGEGESDSRTSQSDSVTSKPAPSSENPVTSDSSRDIAEAKQEVKLPAAVATVLEELELPNMSGRSNDALLARLERALCASEAAVSVRRLSWTRAAAALNMSRSKIVRRAKALAAADTGTPVISVSSAPIKRKADDLQSLDIKTLSDEEIETHVVETLRRLKALIDELKPGMMATYNAECERVQEERKKLQIASAAEGQPSSECTKRLPKRRFPWCARSRSLLARLVSLSRSHDNAALLLAKRALPLFPTGFVRMPTLLRQADLNKEIKVTDIKRPRLGSASQPTNPIQSQPASVIQPPQFPEPIHFSSALTVTTVKNTPDSETVMGKDEKDKQKSVFGNIINSFAMSKDLVVEKQDEKKVEAEKKDDLYIPPNNIGSITITPVLNNTQKQEKKVNSLSTSEKQKSESFIRIRSPAALNEMVNKQEKVKALENIHKRDKDKHKKDRHHSHNHSSSKEKRIDTPLHVDTSYQPKKPKEPTPSPKGKDEVSQKLLENMRVAESKIPRPALIPVSHSPTFAKPDKRPPELKKKKEIVIVSDMDPLAENHSEPVAIDDSSSDIEVVEDKSESDSVPSKDKVSEKVNHRSDGHRRDDRTSLRDTSQEEFDAVMQDLRDLEN